MKTGLLRDISGFPEFGPDIAIALRNMLETIKHGYELSGYVPIETPLVELPELLQMKAEGEVSSQLYGLRLLNAEDGTLDDSKDLALRFDHTVPLARFVAKNYRDLCFPFRRYAIGPVFRGERPKDGRYRQFIQADIDVIGDGALDTIYDAEVISVVIGIFNELAFGTFKVRINNTKVLWSLLRQTGLAEEKLAASVQAVDKLEKIGKESVVNILTDLGGDSNIVCNFIDFISSPHSTDESLLWLKSRITDIEGLDGIQELENVVYGLRELGVNADNYAVDISIARGLNYYTGTIFETTLTAFPSIGSIASGGRYDNLVGALAKNKNLPGVGASIGVTRLLLRLIKLGVVSAKKSTIAEVLITSSGAISARPNMKHFWSRILRENYIRTEVYLVEKPLAKQLEYANKRGFRYAIIFPDSTPATKTMIIRDMVQQHQIEIPEDDFIPKMKALFHSAKE